MDYSYQNKLLQRIVCAMQLDTGFGHVSLQFDIIGVIVGVGVSSRRGPLVNGRHEYKFAQINVRRFECTVKHIRQHYGLDCVTKRYEQLLEQEVIRRSYGGVGNEKI